MSGQSLERRALRIEQDGPAPLYLFSLAARDVADVADVARIGRDDAGRLIGYQRGEKRRHVEQILAYLDSPAPLFPNALIMALPTSTRWKSSRGPAVSDGQATIGTLELPIVRGEGLPRPALIVDGQQRWHALTKTNNSKLAVPVAGFVTDSVELQRDQFLRVNTVQPLPIGLVTELLPEVPAAPSPRLSARQLPAALVEMLNEDPDSPFKGLIKRASADTEARKRAVVSDTVLVTSIEESLNQTSGCLFPYRNIAEGTTDTDAVRATLITYWTAVRDVFPEAWGLPPTQSRLMHGAGIRSMGRLMDRIMSSVDPTSAHAVSEVRKQLELVSPYCHWTTGRWDECRLEWDDVQNVPKHISLLSNYLVRVYMHERTAR